MGSSSSRCADGRLKKRKKLGKIRPRRFGGEGVLIGGQNSNTKCSMTFVNIAVAISALAEGAKTVSHRDQNTVVFSTFFEDFWVPERKRVLKWNFGSFW